METSAIQSLILNQLDTFGYAVLAIITAVIVLGVAYLVFNFGWRATKRSLDGGVSWSAHGAMEHDLTAFKKKQRSLIRRGL